MNYFDYEIRTEVGDAGSYLYHSHVYFQAISTHGPLIVEECGPPAYQNDEDRNLILGDYYNKTDTKLLTVYLLVRSSGPAKPMLWLSTDRVELRASATLPIPLALHTCLIYLLERLIECDSLGQQ